MTLTIGQTQAGTGCTTARAAQWQPHLSAACALFAINTPQRLAAFLAQIGHESGGLSVAVENLNYSCAGLAATWPSRFTPATAAALARQPERIANRVYGGRMGNGDEKSGDGWKYRGRGLIQTTGRTNYQATRDGLRALAQPSADAGTVPDFEASPELLELPQWAALSAAWYWHNCNLNVLADRGDFKGITMRVNGGLNGFPDRLALYEAGKKALT